MQVDGQFVHENPFLRILSDEFGSLEITVVMEYIGDIGWAKPDQYPITFSMLRKFPKTPEFLFDGLPE
jgi:hypothetical protein